MSVPAIDAASPLIPVDAPTVQLSTCATPDADVVAPAPVVTEPPPWSTVNVTVIPASGAPKMSRTTTAGLTGTADPTAANWFVPATTDTVFGGARMLRLTVPVALPDFAV